MKRAFATIWSLSRGRRVTVGFAFAALIGSAVTLYAVPLVSQAVIDGALLRDEARSTAITRTIMAWLGGAEHVRAHLWQPALVMVAITAVAGLLTHLKTRWVNGAAESIARELRDRMYDRLQRLHCRTLDLRPSGDLLQRCTSDVDTLRGFLAGQAIEIGRAVIMLLAPLPLMLSIDPRMTLASVVVLPAIVGFSLVYFMRLRPAFTAKEEAEGRMTTTITENLQGIRVVRAFARQEFERSKFDATSGAFAERDFELYRRLATFWAISDLLCFLQSAIAVSTGLWLLANDRISVGTFFFFISVIGLFIWPVRMMGRILADLGKAVAAIDRIREVLDLPDEREGDDSEPFAPPANRGVAIAFRNVSFAFGDGTKVLDGISFEIPAGSTLGIVGPSGSGKSTIVHLLLRLYDYTEGSITVDGRELRTIPRQAMRSIIGTVMQQPFLYSKSLRENILISAAGHLNTEEAMRNAAAVASVHDSIEAFPQRYDTLLGERGITLSGGQRQRVAIARSLVQSPRLLILDDALSAVDTHTESEILRAFGERRSAGAAADQTTIIVAHRLSTLMHADRIIVIEHGRVTQSGSHAELIAVEGTYRTLWEIQTELQDDDDEGANTERSGGLR
jgi:ATP-binding cassette, subfamily B, bacterial